MSSAIGDLEALAGAWAEAMGRACWQGALALATVWAVCRFCPRLSGNARAWLWRLAYLKLVVTLVWTAPVTLPLLPARLAAAVAIVDIQRIVSGLVGEPGDLTAARRPRRRAVVGAGRLSEVADRRAFLRRHRDDLAAIFQRHLLEVGSRGDVAHVVDVADAARARLAQVARDGDTQRRRVRGRGIEHAQMAALLEDDLAVAGSNRSA